MRQRAALDAVDPLLVLPQVDELVEGLAAGGAAERRRARVGEGVARQELPLQEGAPAHGADEAPLGHVQPEVPLELVLHRELFGAVVALEVADAVDVRAEVPLLVRIRMCRFALLPFSDFLLCLHFPNAWTKSMKQMQFFPADDGDS